MALNYGKVMALGTRRRVQNHARWCAIIWG